MMHQSRGPASTAILAIVVLALSAAPVTADCQMAGPLEEELATAEVVFVGTAAEVIRSMARFEVHEVWAGPVGESVEVHGLTSGVEFSEDDRHWEAGATYLVVPYVEAGVLRDSICSATVEWTDELEVLRPADAVIVGSENAAEAESGSVPMALVAVIGIAAVVVAVSVLAFRRRGEESR
jgi:hypothetical protein